MNIRFLLIGIFLLSISFGAVYAGDQYCKPGEKCWPSESAWKNLDAKFDGQVYQPKNFLKPCFVNAKSTECEAVLKDATNPFYIEDQAAYSQNTGWLDAWENHIPTYVAEVKTPHDIAAAISFAKKHHIKVAVKGAGHDYLGRNTAPDALLIWTHKMRGISMEEAFQPQNCSIKAVPAVTVSAGSRWIEVYNEVTNKNNRYVQGGGCTSVGAVGGFSLGGGFGNYSKKFGTGSGNMLEAEIIMADGEILIANVCQNKDLFWALRGGGGGTFGVVSKITYQTHELPKNFGLVLGNIQAKNDEAFKALLSEFTTFFSKKLLNENWGESLQIKKDNTIQLSLMFQGLSKENVEEIWKEFRAWLSTKSDMYDVDITTTELPANKLWNADYMLNIIPGVITQGRTQSTDPEWWWSGDGKHVSYYWASMFSRWIPNSLFEDKNRDILINALFDASRHSNAKIFVGKGLGFASPEARAREKDTSLHPMALDAAILLKFSDGQSHMHIGVSGYEPDQSVIQQKADNIKLAAKIIRDLTPNSASYSNEADYFEPNWQESLWGPNYPKLLEVKKKYDPDNFFTCHHCVGSEK